MGLPWELLDIEEETAVVGDIDAFIAYIESGEALQDWCDVIMEARRALEGWVATYATLHR